MSIMELLTNRAFVYFVLFVIIYNIIVFVVVTRAPAIKKFLRDLFKVPGKSRLDKSAKKTSTP